jgi:hypothetical protein
MQRFHQRGSQREVGKTPLGLDLIFDGCLGEVLVTVAVCVTISLLVLLYRDHPVFTRVLLFGAGGMLVLGTSIVSARIHRRSGTPFMVIRDVLTVAAIAGFSGWTLWLYCDCA